MKAPKIDSCSFGIMVIDGKTHTDDLVLLPGGRVLKPWRRKRGHRLSMDDLKALVDSSPEVIVIGTGVNGRMIPDGDLKSDLQKSSIELMAAPNREAMEIFNSLAPEKRTGAGFHLTC